MSAIAGIVQLDGRPVQAGLIERMTACMAYRAPDGMSHWQHEGIALGHGLLRTTSQSFHESQPLCNPLSQLTIVMDGRLDNRRELLSTLTKAGHRPLNGSDSALVLSAFEKWGRDCPAKLDGDFAFAIWNGRSRELFCARDHIGTRSFHYALVGSTLLFASDIRAIWYCPLFSPVFNEDFVSEYLGGEWLHHDQTFWQGLHRLMPAQAMTVSAKGLSSQRYWEPNPFSKAPCKTDQDFEAYYRWLLTDIVESMSESHLPLAFEVSGGLDSSALFAVASDLQSKDRLRAPGFQGYTYDFGGVSQIDEMKYVKDVQSFCGRHIQPVAPWLAELEWYQRFAQDFKTFPGFPNCWMGMNLYRQAARNGSRVVISGFGGDEWVGGCDRGYAECLHANDWQGLVACWNEEFSSIGWTKALTRLIRKGLLSQLPGFIKLPLRMAIGQRHYVGFDKEEWLSPRLRRTLEQRRKKFPLQHLPRYARLTQPHQYETLHSPWVLLIQDLEDINCGLMGVEWRRPFVSKRMIEFVFSVPDRLRSSAIFDRVLHRKALKGLLPDSVLARKTKANFMPTYDPQLMDEILSFGQSANPGWVHPDGIETMRRLATQDDEGAYERHGGWPHMHLWAFLGVSALRPQR
jgi:asparagine synthase (glutamine-hydrolysing)